MIDFGEVARRAIAQRAAAVERACEAAIQSGEYGVLIVRDHGREFIGPHPSVPYGMIHEYPHGHPDGWPE